MTEKTKPAKAPSTWRGKAVDPHHGEMQPVKYVSRPNWLMQIGSKVFEKLTGK